MCPQVIQDDFVETRQNDPNKMSVEDFQTLLVVVRSGNLLYGYFFFLFILYKVKQFVFDPI